MAAHGQSPIFFFTHKKPTLTTQSVNLRYVLYLKPVLTERQIFMANQTTILRTTTFTNYAALHKATRAPELRPLITRTQGDAIAEACDRFLHAAPDVTLTQRTPKGTIYVFIDGELQYTINFRGKISRAYDAGKHLENSR
jgi:hypothetical protein